MIEDTMQPATAVEIALLERIRELRIALMQKGNYDGVSHFPQYITVQSPPPMTLRLAAQCEAGWENERLSITARTYGRDKASIGIASYMSGTQLAKMTPHQAIRWVDENHKQVTNRLARMFAAMPDAVGTPYVAATVLREDAS